MISMTISTRHSTKTGRFLQVAFGFRKSVQLSRIRPSTLRTTRTTVSWSGKKATNGGYHRNQQINKSNQSTHPAPGWQYGLVVAGGHGVDAGLHQVRDGHGAMERIERVGGSWTHGGPMDLGWSWVDSPTRICMWLLQLKLKCIVETFFFKMFYIGRIACLRFPESQSYASRGTTPLQVISNYLHFIQDWTHGHLTVPYFVKRCRSFRVYLYLDNTPRSFSTNSWLWDVMVDHLVTDALGTPGLGVWWNTEIQGTNMYKLWHYGVWLYPWRSIFGVFVLPSCSSWARSEDESIGSVVLPSLLADLTTINCMMCLEGLDHWLWTALDVLFLYLIYIIYTI